MSESKDGLLVLVLILVLAALVGVIVWKLPAGQQVMAYLRPQASTPPEAAPPVGEEKEDPKKTESKKLRGSTSRHTPASAQAAPAEKSLTVSASPSPQNTAQAVALRYRIPVVEEMQPGMERLRILSSYGQPNLRTVAVDSGRMVETYVFLKDQEREAVIARLYNGKLVNATTTPY